MSAGEVDSRAGKDADASKLLRDVREFCSSLPMAGDEWIPGSADSLSELVKFELEDSESNVAMK